MWLQETRQGLFVVFDMLDKVLYWDYFVVTIFLITSGATFWVGGLSAAITFSFLLLVALANSVLVRQDLGINLNSSISFIICIIVLCIANYLVYNVDYKDNSTIGYIICLFATYLIISRYDFRYFRHLLTNLVFWICLIGIPVFLLFQFDILPTYNMSVQSGSNYTMFLVYTLGWPEAFGRFTGIWHEAGACQIILNTVLWLHFDNIVNWTWEDGQLKKILVILLATLLTMSTGGYMVLMLLILAVVMNMKIEGRYKALIYFTMFIFALVALALIFYSPVVQNKLFNDEDDNVSKMDRLADIVALWQMTWERPLLGYGLGSTEFWQLSDRYGNTACSTGLLTYSASLGITWLICFSCFLYAGIRRFNMGKASIILLIAVVMMQFNEKFIEYPITNIFIFKFASYFYDEYDSEEYEEYNEYDTELSVD